MNRETSGARANAPESTHAAKHFSAAARVARREAHTHARPATERGTNTSGRDSVIAPTCDGTSHSNGGRAEAGTAGKRTALRVWLTMSERGRAAAGVAAGAATILAGVGLMTTAGYLISRAAERPPVLDLMVVFVSVRFFGLARPALRYVDRLVAHDVTFRALQRIRRWFYDALLPLSPARLLELRAGDLLARMAHDVDSLQEIHLRLVAPAIVATIVGSLVVGVLMLVDVRLALVTFALLLVNGVIWPLLAQRWTRGLAVRRARERAALTAQLVPTLQGLEDLLVFGRADAAARDMAAAQARLDRLEDREGRAQAAHAAVGAALAQVAMWSALAMTIPLALDGRLATVWIAAIALGIVAAFEAVEGLPAAWQFKERLDEAAQRVFAVIDAQPAVADDAAATGATMHRAGNQALATDAASNCTALSRESTEAALLPRAGDTGARAHGVALDFSHVTFAHSRSGTSIASPNASASANAESDLASSGLLRDITFSVAPGEQIAIVGPSGGGKSTLLSLAMRVWDPRAGRIARDGCDLRAWRLHDLRAHAAVMPQQVYVFNDTLRENVRLLRPDASDAEIEDALRRAQLGTLFDALPHGLDSRLDEHGSRLSAGELQQLGLARLLLSRAPLALVDEPTANLDAATERHVLHTLRAWSRDRTLLLVTHRLVHLDTMDRILVIDRGRLVEQGSYDELIARDGLFVRLLESQRGLVAA